MCTGAGSTPAPGHMEDHEQQLTIDGRHVPVITTSGRESAAAAHSPAGGTPDRLFMPVATLPGQQVLSMEDSTGCMPVATLPNLPNGSHGGSS